MNFFIPNLNEGEKSCSHTFTIFFWFLVIFWLWLVFNYFQLLSLCDLHTNPYLYLKVRCSRKYHRLSNSLLMDIHSSWSIAIPVKDYAIWLVDKPPTFFGWNLSRTALWLFVSIWRQNPQWTTFNLSHSLLRSRLRSNASLNGKKLIY